MIKLRALIATLLFFTLFSSAYAIDNLESEYNHTLPPNVMLVLDASGSMADQNLSKSKIEAARGVISELMSGWNKDIAVGLTVYGHRQKNDCDDIQVLVPVSRLSATEINKQITKIQPKGETPLTEAVRRAAEELNYVDQKATIILISDGAETCHKDPCLLSKELEARGVELTIYVIGFDVQQQEEAGLRCLAENTGGSYYQADNENGLKAALAHVVEDIQSTEPTPNVHLRAELGDSGKEIYYGLRWKILSDKADLEGNRKKIEFSNVATPDFHIPAGNYMVEVEYGKTITQEPVTVKLNQPLNHVVKINAGVVRLGAKASEKGELLQKGLRWWVTEPQPDIEGNYDVYVSSSKPAPIFQLAPGDYRVKVKYGGAEIDEPLTIEAGKEIEEIINVNAGVLQLSGLASNNSSNLNKDLRWWINEYDVAKQRVGKNIFYSRHSELKHPLPAGRYWVKGRYGNAENHLIVDIPAGELKQEVMNFHAGVVQLKLKNPGKKKPRWWIQSIKPKASGKHTTIAYSNKPEPQFILQQGSYQVVVRQSEQETKKIFTVKEGEREEVEI